MSGEGPQDACRHRAPVPASVEREVLPPVGIPRSRDRGKVGRVGQDPVEAPQASGEVGPDGLDGQPLRLGSATECRHGGRIDVGRNHPMRVRPGSLEGGQSAPAADLEHLVPPTAPSEARQQPAVFPDGIHRDPVHRARMRHVSRSGERRVPKSS